MLLISPAVQLIVQSLVNSTIVCHAFVDATAYVAYLGQALKLQIYPLARDSMFYVVSLLLLVVFLVGGSVFWWEGLLLTFGYVAYVMYMVSA